MKLKQPLRNKKGQFTTPKKAIDQSKISKPISDWFKGRIIKVDTNYQCRECKKANAIWMVNLAKPRYYCKDCSIGVGFAISGIILTTAFLLSLLFEPLSEEEQMLNDMVKPKL